MAVGAERLPGTVTTSRAPSMLTKRFLWVVGVTGVSQEGTEGTQVRTRHLGRERDRPVSTVTLAQVEAPANSGHMALHFSPWLMGAQSLCRWARQ